jgi:hypothetical protein
MKICIILYFFYKMGWIKPKKHFTLMFLQKGNYKDDLTYTPLRFCITASGSESHQLLAA